MRDWQRQYRLSKERWHYQVIRLDHDDAQMLRALAEREGTTVPELVRTFVVWGLEESINAHELGHDAQRTNNQSKRKPKGGHGHGMGKIWASDGG
jgi:hypothetical protein